MIHSGYPATVRNTHTHITGWEGGAGIKKQGKLIIAPKIVPIVEGAKSNDDAAQEQGDGTGDGFFYQKTIFRVSESNNDHTSPFIHFDRRIKETG